LYLIFKNYEASVSARSRLPVTLLIRTISLEWLHRQRHRSLPRRMVRSWPVVDTPNAQFEIAIRERESHRALAAALLSECSLQPEHGICRFSLQLLHLCCHATEGSHRMIQARFQDFTLLGRFYTASVFGYLKSENSTPIDWNWIRKNSLLSLHINFKNLICFIFWIHNWILFSNTKIYDNNSIL
jgi:hypothetical protein